MSRVPPGSEVHFTKPRNNVYTALAFAGLVAVILALVAMMLQANELFGKWNLFS